MRKLRTTLTRSTQLRGPYVRPLAALLLACALGACGGGGSSSPAFSCSAQTVNTTLAGGVATATLMPNCNATPTSCSVAPTASCNLLGGAWLFTANAVGSYSITWSFSGGSNVASGSSPGGTVTVALPHGTWSPTGSMSAARVNHTATLLPNGLVLAAGGYNTVGQELASTELYNPASGTWTGSGALSTARDSHTATLLPNGLVLVAGGETAVTIGTNSAELYNSTTGVWSPTGNLNTARYGHTATLLPNGLVLVAGGQNTATNALASAELYNPATGMWTPTGNLNTAHAGAPATLLQNGLVLVAGGSYPILDGGRLVLASAELYDPVTGAWTPTGSMNRVRSLFEATLLPDGRVLVSGGDPPQIIITTSAELYNPATGTWASAGDMNIGRFAYSATLLAEGQVLVAGGQGSGSDLPTGLVTLSNVEIYDPNSGTWKPTGSMNTAREGHTATRLPSGQVVVAGGASLSIDLPQGQLISPSAEIFSP